MTKRTRPKPELRQVCLSVPEASRLTGLGHSTLYDLVADGSLPKVDVGGRRNIRVPVWALELWLSGHPLPITYDHRPQ